MSQFPEEPLNSVAIEIADDCIRLVFRIRLFSINLYANATPGEQIFVEFLCSLSSQVAFYMEEKVPHPVTTTHLASPHQASILLPFLCRAFWAAAHSILCCFNWSDVKSWEVAILCCIAACLRSILAFAAASSSAFFLASAISWSAVLLASNSVTAFFHTAEALWRVLSGAV